MNALLPLFLCTVAFLPAVAQAPSVPIDQVTSRHFLTQLIKDNVYIFISPGTATSSVKHRVDPILPAGPDMARISGTVGIAFEIARDGAVRNAIVVSGPKLLQIPVLAAVRQWTFEPVKINGEPTTVATSVQLTVSNF